MDILHNVLVWLDHNRYKALAVLVVCVILAYGVGCESKTISLAGGGVKVGRVEFSLEAAAAKSDLAQERIGLDAAIAAHNERVVAFNERVDASVAELDRADKLRAEIFNLAGSVITAWATGGTVPTAALIGTAITAIGLIGGFGAYADGRRKDGVIAKAKSSGGGSPPPAETIR